MTPLNEYKQKKERNMKRTIRLTESDLRNMIAESLSGLDWRTLSNAAKKADERGEHDRARRFRDYATLRSAHELYPGRYGQYSSASIDFDDNGNAFPYGTRKDQWGDYDTVEGFGENDGDYGTYTFTSTKYPDQTFGGDPSYLGDAGKHYKELEKQARSYNAGKSKYVKGKGWQNESIDRKIHRIVRECLRRNAR